MQIHENYRCARTDPNSAIYFKNYSKIGPKVTTWQEYFRIDPNGVNNISLPSVNTPTGYWGHTVLCFVQAACAIAIYSQIYCVDTLDEHTAFLYRNIHLTDDKILQFAQRALLAAALRSWS